MFKNKLTIPVTSKKCGKIFSKCEKKCYTKHIKYFECKNRCDNKYNKCIENQNILL